MILYVKLFPASRIITLGALYYYYFYYYYYYCYYHFFFMPLIRLNGYSMNSYWLFKLMVLRKCLTYFVVVVFGFIWCLIFSTRSYQYPWNGTLREFYLHIFCFSDLSFNKIQNIPKKLFVHVKNVHTLWVWQAFTVDSKTVGFFLKIMQWRNILFDRSRFEYAKIRTVLQSTFTVVYTIIYSRGFKV